jgi:hypothetical protein
MIARAFCELFVAGCLEVETQVVDGETRRRYRAADDIDLAFLGKIEQAIVRCLRSFCSFEELLARAARELGCAQPAQAITPRDAALLAEMGEVIDDALEYLPPACSCSV